MAKRNDSIEMKSDPQTKAETGRIFKVVRGQVGPWNASVPDVFTEAEFVRLHPIPDSPQAREQVDAETYHDALLQRLLALEVIVHAPDAKPTPTPIGALPPKPIKNALIEAAVKEALAAKEKTNAMRASDVQQVAGSGTHAEPVGASR